MIALLMAAAAVVLPVPADLPPELAAVAQPTTAVACGSWGADACAQQQRNARYALVQAWASPAMTPADRDLLLDAVRSRTTPEQGTDWQSAQRGYGQAYADARKPLADTINAVSPKRSSPFMEALAEGFARGLADGLDRRYSYRPRTTITRRCSADFTVCKTKVR